MTRIAVYSCGTGSTRLLIADVVDGKIESLVRETQITRLGQGVDEEKNLHPDAIDRVTSALRAYMQLAQSHQVEKSVLIATSAVRDAENRDEFLAKAREITGADVHLLDGQAEAAMAFLGATSDLPEGQRVVVMDSGGGSTEFGVGIVGQEPDDVVSIDYGAVRITERLLKHDPPQAEELSQAISLVRDELEQVLRDVPAIEKADVLVAVAGTATTAAAVEQGLEPYDPAKVHHFELSKAATEEVFRTLAMETIEQRKKNPGLHPDRAPIIVGGMVVLVSALRYLGYESCLVSESDILEGAALKYA